MILQLVGQPVQAVALPASWGSRPDVLPRLRSLLLGCRVDGALPAAWARGLCRLEQLAIHPELGQVGEFTLPPAWPVPNGTAAPSRRPAGGDASTCSGTVARLPRGKHLGRRDGALADAPAAGIPLPPGPQAGPRVLPEAWATGFPRLTHLTLGAQGLTGTFPNAWQLPGAFPSLQAM